MKQKLIVDADGIDEVIILLDYIEQIKRPENKIDEIS